MMVRIDLTGRVRQSARAMRASLNHEPGVTFQLEPGPRLPFRESSVDELFVGSMVAWRSDIAQTLDEFWRVCKAGALIHMTLPHASSTIAQSRDANPRPQLTLNTFNYYDPRTKPWDAPSTAFTVERAHLRVAASRAAQDSGLALARGPFAQFIEKVANGSRGSQYRFERWFAGVIGGFEEFDVVLSVVKPRERPQTRSIAEPTPLHVTSDVGHEAAALENDGVTTQTETTSGFPRNSIIDGERR